MVSLLTSVGILSKETIRDCRKAQSHYLCHENKVEFRFSAQSHYSKLFFHCACMCIVFSMCSAHPKEERDNKKLKFII